MSEDRCRHCRRPLWPDGSHEFLWEAEACAERQDRATLLAERDALRAKLAEAEKERDEALAEARTYGRLLDDSADATAMVERIATHAMREARARRAARAWKLAAKKYRKRVAPNRTAELLALQEQVEATTRRMMARAGVRLRGEDDEKGGP